VAGPGSVSGAEVFAIISGAGLLVSCVGAVWFYRQTRRRIESEHAMHVSASRARELTQSVEPIRRYTWEILDYDSVGSPRFVVGSTNAYRAYVSRLAQRTGKIVVGNAVPEPNAHILLGTAIGLREDLLDPSLKDA
jgi:hypothetical protein